MLRGRGRELRSERSDLQSCPHRLTELLRSLREADVYQLKAFVLRGAGWTVNSALCARSTLSSASLPKCRQVQCILLACAPSTPPLLQPPVLCPSKAGAHGSHRLSAPRHLAQTLTSCGGAEKEGCPRSRLLAVALRGGPDTTTTHCWALRGASCRVRGERRARGCPRALTLEAGK